MTHIIIEDVDSVADLHRALSIVTEVFADRWAFDQQNQIFTKHPSDEGLLENEPYRERADGDERPVPMPYMPCPRRGSHQRLVDCWMCWSDVHRGAAVECDALADTWDAALLRLLHNEAL